MELVLSVWLCLLSLPAVSTGALLPSACHSHTLSINSQSSQYIFTSTSTNVHSHCHIFIFTSANAPGSLFQILLRDGYWGVIDVAVLWLQGNAATLSGKSNGSAAWNGHRLPFYVTTKQRYTAKPYTLLYYGISTQCTSHVLLNQKSIRFMCIKKTQWYFVF